MNNQSVALLDEELPGDKKLKILGVVTLILGVLCLLAPFVVGELVAVLVGVMVLIAGIGRLVWAFHSRTVSMGIMRFLIGGLTTVCGILMITSPIFAAGVLTLLLTFYFLLEGITELTVAFQMKSNAGRSWMFVDGILSLLLGLAIFSGYPLMGTWAIGVLLGIKLIFIGIIILTTGSEPKAVQLLREEFQAP